MLSFWEKDSFYADADIAIIGAGLMGLWAALEIKKHSPGTTVTILERSSTPLGASTRNAGFACFGSLTELLSDEKNMGTNAMLEIVEMRYKGIEKIKSTFSSEQIDLDKCGGYEALGPINWAGEINDRINYINQLLTSITGKANCFSNASNQMSSIGLKNFDHLIFNPLEAGIHSGKLVSALTQLAIEKGIRILNGIEIIGWEKLNDKISIRSNQKKSIQANRLLICTNGFTNELIPSLAIEPARGQIILTAPIKGLSTKGTFHFDEGFYYWRNLGDRILLGGARNSDFSNERTTNLDGSELIRQKLVEFLNTHLDTTASINIEQSWSGIMGFTENKLPLFQQIESNVSVSIACNGMGVALTPVFAEKVALELLN
ncbi:MAG: FAD-binding oxidoreductase [Sphingobacteriia bacterium]|nr:MAG: FAD-binding oxidoreductase [Sphingobacteriia bacterium]